MSNQDMQENTSNDAPIIDEMVASLRQSLDENPATEEETVTVSSWEWQRANAGRFFKRGVTIIGQTLALALLMTIIGISLYRQLPRASNDQLIDNPIVEQIAIEQLGDELPPLPTPPPPPQPNTP